VRRDEGAGRAWEVVEEERRKRGRERKRKEKRWL
jgi:hypothetical protein